MGENENELEIGEQAPFDIFSQLGVSAESVERFLRERDRFDTSKQICMCGHAINKHSGYERDCGICLTGRHYCPCAKPNPVLIASDSRYFMRKTYGTGSKHALSSGMLRLQQEKKKATWLIEPGCWFPDCNSGNPLIFPVALDDSNSIIERPGPKNVMLCETCILRLQGLAGNEGRGWVW